MKGKTLSSILLTLFLILALLVSCNEPGKTTTSQPTQTTTTAITKTTTTATASDVPQYGGTYTVASLMPVMQFDEAFGPMSHSFAGFTHQELFMGDWAKGPAGTKEADWTYSGNNRYDLKIGAVAESLEVPEPGHMIFKIRKGIKFGLNPEMEASRLVNGRELTAQDCVYTFQRQFTSPRAYLAFAYSNVGKNAVFSAPDDYTFDVKVSVDAFADAFSIIPDMADIIAPELVEKYGDLLKWEVCVGTGPFNVTDFVDGSSATFVRNDKFCRPPFPMPGSVHLPHSVVAQVIHIAILRKESIALHTGNIG